MDVFLSYSASDRRWAEELREGLQRQGLSVWHDREDLKPGRPWAGKIEDAIRSADNILVLIGPRQSPDEAQQFTWRTALEAVWQDPHKRLIPVLLRGAEVPTFVRSSGDQVQVVRVDAPQDTRAAVQRIAAAATRRQDVGTKARGAVSLDREADFDLEPKGSGAAKQGLSVGDDDSSFDEDSSTRSARLSDIEQFAERLKR